MVAVMLVSSSFPASPRASLDRLESPEAGPFSDSPSAHQNGALGGFSSPGPYVTPGLCLPWAALEAISA